MSESIGVPSRSSGGLMKRWKRLGDPLHVNNISRSFDWTSAQHLIKAAEPLLLANSVHLRGLLKRSNDLLAPLEDPLLTDYGVHRWLAHSREESYSDWLAWVLSQIKEPHQLFQALKIIDDPVAEDALRTVALTSEREVFTAEGHPGHSGRIDLQMVVPGKVLIQIELKLTSAGDSDVEKGEGYSRSANRHGVPLRHVHRRIIATDGDASLDYPGDYHLVTWRHVVVQLRIIAARLVEEHRLLPAAAVLGFVGAVEQHIIGFSSSDARSAFEGKLVPLNTGLIDYLCDSLNGES